MYEIEHVCPLSPDQQKSIASAIVKIHSEKFTTPSLFVNVRFKDTSAIPLFVAGEQVSLPRRLSFRCFSLARSYRRAMRVMRNARSSRPRTSQAFKSYSKVWGELQRKINLIQAHLRHGPNRTMEQYNEVCSAISSVWKSIVGTTPELELRAIFILGDVTAGYEAGFPIPPAGEDKAWLKQNLSGFKKLADDGDLDFQGVMHELQTREDFKGVLAY